MQGTTVNSLPSHLHERSKVKGVDLKPSSRMGVERTHRDRGQLNFVANMSLQKVSSMVTKYILYFKCIFHKIYVTCR